MDTTSESLQTQLAAQSKQIDLMLTIDRIRDEAEDEGALVTAAVSTICQTIGADLGLLSVIDPDDQRLEVRALIDQLGTLDQIGDYAAEAMCRKLAWAGRGPR